MTRGVAIDIELDTNPAPQREDEVIIRVTGDQFRIQVPPALFADIHESLERENLPGPCPQNPAAAPDTSGEFPIGESDVQEEVLRGLAEDLADYIAERWGA